MKNVQIVNGIFGGQNWFNDWTNKASHVTIYLWGCDPANVCVPFLTADRSGQGACLAIDLSFPSLQR